MIQYDVLEFDVPLKYGDALYLQQWIQFHTLKSIIHINAMPRATVYDPWILSIQITIPNNEPVIPKIPPNGIHTFDLTLLSQSFTKISRLLPLLQGHIHKASMVTELRLGKLQTTKATITFWHLKSV